MKNNYLLAILSSVLLLLAWPPVPYSSPLLLVAFVPLLIAIENIIRGSYNKKGRKIFGLTFLSMFIWNTGSIYWVYNAMNAYLPSYVSILIALIPFGLAPLLMASVFRLYYELRKIKSITYSFIGLVSLWLSYEFLHQWWSLSFPWMSLGNGFANFHQLVQWYEVTGIYGGTTWIWVSNLLVFLLVWQKKEKIESVSNKKLSIGLAAVLLIPTIYSFVRYSTYEEHINPSEIVVVQPNIDPYQKFGSITPEQQLETLISLSEKVAKANTEFFLWPETALSSSSGINEDEFRSHPTYDRIIDFLDRYKNGNVLSGIESYRLYSEPKTKTAREWGDHYLDHFNAAVLIDQSTKVQFYHKSKLVPGVEQMPFGDLLGFLKPLFAHFGGTTGGYGKQDEPSVFYSQSGIGAAPVICYESIWGDYVADYVTKGAQFIAIVTNDGWWGNTSGKDQHLQYAKLRAIENRRWVARSANTGISGFINQRGDIVQETEWWQADARTQEINLNEELTIYSTNTDFFTYLGFAGSLLVLFYLIIPKRKNKHSL